jgi:UDP-glucose:(heptosyl)LPS alpha-1,3-glucosyltransferase
MTSPHDNSTPTPDGPRYRIGFLLERYFPVGGKQRDMLRFAQRLAAKGHSVTICVGQWEGPHPEGIEIEILDVRRGSNHRTVEALQQAAIEFQRQGRFDVLVGFLRMAALDVYFAADVCLRAQLQRTGKLWRRILPRYRSYLRLERNLFGPESDTHILALCEPQIRDIQQQYSTSDDRITLLPPSLQCESLLGQMQAGPSPDELRKTLGAGDQDVLLLMVGSDYHRKGADRIIRGLASLSPESLQRCQCVIAGRDNAKSYEQLARSLGVAGRVHFLGGVAEVGPWYAASDVLLHPARAENTGVILLEGLLGSAAVLCSGACGYASHIVESQGGIVCDEPFDQHQFNRHLATLVEQNDLREEYCQRAGAYARSADLCGMDATVERVVLEHARRRRGTS